MLKRKKSREILKTAFLHQYISLILLSPFGVVTTVVDSLFVGRFFGDLGSTYLSAIGLLTPVNMLFFLMSETLSAGLNATISREIGRGNRQSANTLLRAGILAGLAAATIFMLLNLVFRHPIVSLLGASEGASALHNGAVAYLCGFAAGVPGFMLIRLLLPLLPLDSDIKRIGLATVVMAVVDILMDAINVFVIGGGMFGMSMASTISIYAALMLILPHFFQRRYALRISRGVVRRSSVSEIIRYGLPTGYSNLLIALQALVMNRVLIVTGGETALLANSVLSTCSEVFCATNRSLGSVVHTMSGVQAGEENPEGIRKVRRFALTYGTLGNVISGTLMILLAVPLTSAFVESRELVTAVAPSLRLFGLALCLMSVNCYYQNYLEASGQQRAAAVFVVFYCGIVPILNCLLFGLLPGNWYGAFAAASVTQVGLWGLLLFYVSLRNRRITFSPEAFLLLPKGFGPEDADVMNFYINSRKEVMTASSLAEDFVLDRGGEKKTAMFAALAVEEMANNVFTHGTPRSGDILVNIRLVKNREGQFSLTICDNCDYFDPVARLHDLEDQKGLGIELTAGVASSFDYVRTYDTNYLIIQL